MKPIFRRSDKNPVLTARDMPFAADAAYNPGATEQGNDVVLLVRVENAAGRSSIYVARSKNGVIDWRVEPEPILAYGVPEWPYEAWGCEDPRVVYLAEEECWYITYTAYSPAGAAVAIARSHDLCTAERIGLILSPNNKDAALFPHQFNGRFKDRWAVLHRPDAGGGMTNIWSAYSPDLVHWGQPHCVLTAGSGPAWDAVGVGTGAPPVLTEYGWLLIYHGVKLYGGQLVYRAGVAMLDKDQPHKLIARSPNSIFQAEAPYEKSGSLPNVVFPTGLLRRGDELWMYYGATDTCTCLAIAKLEDVLGELESVDRPRFP